MSQMVLCLGRLHWRPLVAVLAAVGLALLAGRAPAQTLGSDVEFAILVDAATGAALFERNADTPMPPASMAKLMTAAVIFEALRDGRLSMDDTFPISEHAWRTGGAPSGTSTMFAPLGSNVLVADLLRGVIVQSANDGAIALAEGVAGTETAFAERMNQQAARIGLADSHFTNATGLPDPDQRVTARDLALLAAHLIREFPEYYPMFAEAEFTWNNITQPNRNGLLALGIGVDGLKTGFTEESGYGMVASAVRDGRRLIAVVAGADSESDRDRETRALIDWGYQTYRSATLFGADRVVADADVFGGAEPRVGLVLGEPLDILVPREAGERLEAAVRYSGPVPAPVASGQEIGVLTVTLDGRELAQAPVYAAAAVPLGSLTQRASDALLDLLFGWW